MNILKQVQWAQGVSQPQDLELVGTAAFSVGEVGYINSAGEVSKAVASGTTTIPVMVISVNGCGAGGAGVFRPWGVIVNKDWTWTAGQKLYLSTSTAGAMTSTAPTTYILPVAVAFASTAVLFYPSLQNDYTPNTQDSDLSISDGKHITVGTGTGTKFGTGTSQKLGFFNSTPVDKPGSTEDMKDLLVSLGFMTDGGATPLNLDGGVFSAGAVTFTADNTVNAGVDFIFQSTTGSKIATGATQKLGFWNATPIVQPSGASQAAVVTTDPVSSSAWGFSGSSQAKAIVTLVNAMRTALVNTGLIKGSA